MLFAVGGHYSKWKKKSFAELGARAGDIIDWTIRITGEVQSLIYRNTNQLIPTSNVQNSKKGPFWFFFEL